MISKSGGCVLKEKIRDIGFRQSIEKHQERGRRINRESGENPEQQPLLCGKKGVS